MQVYLVANYITKLRGLKPTDAQQIKKLTELQIISQNYVVWNRTWMIKRARFFISLQIISQNYVVWNPRTLFIAPHSFLLQIISQNYVVWNK